MALPYIYIARVDLMNKGCNQDLIALSDIHHYNIDNPYTLSFCCLWIESGNNLQDSHFF